MLKACCLVYPCLSVPALSLCSLFLSVSYVQLCVFVPFSLVVLASIFSSFPLLYSADLLQGMEQRLKGSPCWFWLLIILRKLNIFHLFSLLSTLRLLPFCFPFPFFRSDKRIKERNPMFPSYLRYSLLLLSLFFSCFFFLFFLPFWSPSRRGLYSLITALIRKDSMH